MLAQRVNRLIEQPADGAQIVIGAHAAEPGVGEPAPKGLVLEQPDHCVGEPVRIVADERLPTVM